MRCAVWIAAAAVAVVAFATLSRRAPIAPVIIADNAYLFLAADRLYEGLGLTTPPPRAPTEAWDWQRDWAFLTQWPMGYPLVLYAARGLLGVPTVRAAEAVNLLCCGVALVGWFAWVKRAVPAGLAGLLLAAVAAGCSVSVAMFVNPSTDTILVAVLPLVLLMTNVAVGEPGCDGGGVSCRHTMLLLTLTGLVAGGLFWIRYASVFVPLGVFGYLLVERWLRHRLGLRHISVFALAAAVPIAALLIVNRTFGVGSSQAQLNLGQTVGFDFAPGLIGEAWWKFTEFGFYNHHGFSHWTLALWPLAVVAAALCIRPARRALRSFASSPMVCLSALVAAALLVVLIGATTFFSAKFDYAALGRYYQPVKPLYFLLFVGPVLLIPHRVMRGGACAALLVACSWLVQQEWPRPYRRWLAANYRETAYGRRAMYFEPNSTALYNWLATQKADDLLVCSNFHDDIALETWIPACPTPRNAVELEAWIERAKRARGVADMRVLFVLDPENHGRSYFLPPPGQLVEAFDLVHPPNVPLAIAPYVYEPRPLGPLRIGSR